MRGLFLVSDSNNLEARRRAMSLKVKAQAIWPACRNLIPLSDVFSLAFLVEFFLVSLSLSLYLSI